MSLFVVMGALLAMARFYLIGLIVMMVGGFALKLGVGRLGTVMSPTSANLANTVSIILP